MTRRRHAILAACGLAICVAWGAPRASARNIDLSTVPDRATVQLTIYNSEDLTLVRETRRVTFKKGENPLQFSWANTLIDPSSVELRFKDHADQLTVVDTTFPHDKPQMLYWNVQSELDGEAAVEITYFTSGISWAADYVCIANADETAMGFEGFVRVVNNSGEDYENAQVRLVVGNVNLVQRIAELAQIAMQRGDADGAARLGGMRKEALKKMAEGKDKGEAGNKLRELAAEADDFADKFEQEKTIAKESLSEYFIYTIDGTETITNGWAKRMRSFEGLTVPFKVQYRYRPAEYGDQLMRMYLLTNNAESKLGTTPLPDGVIRVFRDNGREGLSFLTAYSTKYVAIGDKIEVPLGVDPDVVFELVKLRAWRDNIWMKLHGADLFRRVDQPGVEIDVRSTVAGWDDHAVYTQRVRNYTAKAIEVEVRRPWDGHAVFRSSLEPKLYDFRTPQFTATIAAGAKRELLFEVLTHQGRNAKQNNVTLEQAEIKP